jgi:hypothetical protein
MKALKDWADLFKRKRDGGLSRNEAIGLWGELSILLELSKALDGAELELMRGWRGPHGDQRDVGLNGVRVEIKTQLATSAKSLQISSLDQLDDRGDRLFIALNRISPSQSGSSLRELIATCHAHLSTKMSACSEFDRKIELSGYVEDSQISNEKFELDERTLFRAHKGFPRLTSNNVDVGITAAAYTIAGARLDDFCAPWDTLIEAIHGKS